MDKSICFDNSAELERELSIQSAFANRAVYFLAKRSIDIVFSLFLLILLSPLLLLIAIIVRFDSPGPAIFSQTRVGCRLRWKGLSYIPEIFCFKFYKFRSMFYKVDESIHKEFIEAYIENNLEKLAQLQKGPVKKGNEFKLNHDDRITRIGKFLRNTSLDELPQLFNVLKGDISLVGPRPDLPYSVEHYEPWHMQRLSTIQGISGLWQISARNSSSFEDFVKTDLEYINNQSLWLDLKIILKTPLAIFDRKGN